MKSSIKNVAIIGAGISGLTTASDLTKSSYNVSVFEKSRGPGGRCATRREKDFKFDHGAQYFTVSNPEFQNQVDLWLQDQIVAEWQGHLVSTNGADLKEVRNAILIYYPEHHFLSY